MTELIKTTEEKYQAVELAYPIALDAYNIMLNRLDVVDKRLETVLTFGVTLSFAAPPVAALKNISFNSKWFFAAAIVFGLAISVGLHARLSGYIKIMMPMKIYDNFLHFNEWEFKKNMIFFAGQHCDHNSKLARRRGHFTSLAAGLFLLEGILLAVWFTLSQS
jgi:hypothetical protein